MKTLATLLSKGYVALYIEAVYVVVFDKRDSFCPFTEMYTQVAFVRSMPRLWMYARHIAGRKCLFYKVK